MKSSIVIPTRHRSASLRSALNSLAQQTEKPFEVIVVSDGEDPATRDLSNQFQTSIPVRWIFKPGPLGQASAQNAGAEAATSDLLLFLDDDMTAAPLWVAMHTQAHLKNPSSARIAALGKTVHSYSSPPSSKFERLLREQMETLLDKTAKSLACGDPDFMARACFISNCSIRRVHFLATGGFEAQLGYRGRAEYEFGDRLYRSGFRFEFEPCAVVHHQASLDLESDSRRLIECRGPSDLYRARQKGQRDPQTKMLTHLFYGDRLRVCAHRLAWRSPALFRGAANASRALANITGSKAALRLWRAFSLGQYWESVRKQGETTESLRELAGRPLPILMFHSISAPPRPRRGALSISPTRFSALMARMQKLGFEAVLPQGENLNCRSAARPVLITLDDGCEDFYFEAFPVLEKLEFKAMIFVVAGWIGKFSEWTDPKTRRLKMLSQAQIREMQQHGFQFGSHSLTHPWLTRCSDSELCREVKDSKSRLEDVLGAEVSCFAYPYGDVDIRVRAAVAEAGYKFAMSTRQGKNQWEDPLWLKRVGVTDADNSLSFWLKLTTGRDHKNAAARWLLRRFAGRRSRPGSAPSASPAELAPAKQDESVPVD